MGAAPITPTNRPNMTNPKFDEHFQKLLKAIEVEFSEVSSPTIKLEGYFNGKSQTLEFFSEYAYPRHGGPIEYWCFIEGKFHPIISSNVEDVISQVKEYLYDSEKK